MTDGTQPSSSTLIRHAVAEGDFGRVRELSDQVFRFTGVVVVGDQRGREMGFPTANVPVEAGHGGARRRGLRRLGDPAGHSLTALAGRDLGRHQPDLRRPGAPGRGVRLDRDDLELYGVEIAIDFYARLRGQVKYTGMEALIKQMHRDVEQVRHLLHQL